tara:strand:- start:286 stop:1071 length:786 start_codon:yes stop_codon:yes gene_type:complete
MLKNKTAIILCGGKGTRLGVLGKNTPKTLIKIQGKEILWYIIKILKVHGYNNFIIPLGYKGNQIKKFFKRNKNFGSKVNLINTGVNTNIGKRIYMVENYIKSKDVLLLNGDAIFDFDLTKIFNNHIKKKIGITFISGEITYQYGTVGVKNGKVVDFRRNILYESLLTRNSRNYIAFNYAGISLINSNLLSKFRNVYKKSENFEQKIFPKFIKDGKSNFVKISGFWHSIDNIKDIKAINEKKYDLKKFLGIKKLKKKILKIK